MHMDSTLIWHTLFCFSVKTARAHLFTQPAFLHQTNYFTVHHIQMHIFIIPKLFTCIKFKLYFGCYNIKYCSLVMGFFWGGAWIFWGASGLYSQTLFTGIRILLKLLSVLVCLASCNRLWGAFPKRLYEVSS